MSNETKGSGTGLLSGLKDATGGSEVEKPVEVTIREKEIPGDSEENRKLRGIGKALPRDSSFRYAGSIGIHIYTQALGPDVQVITQDCLDGDKLSAAVVNAALYKASVDIARAYGMDLSKKQKRVIKEM